MKENINIALMIERSMLAFGCKTQRQLSDIFGISPENFSAKKRRGTLTKLIEKEAYRRGISYDWIKTGQGSMLAGHHPPVAESPATYGHSSIPPAEPLLNLTARVLSTDSIFRTALESNVMAFHKAVELAEKVAVNEARINQQQREIEELRAEVAALSLPQKSEKKVV